MSTDRYLPGPFRTAAEGLKKDDNGALNVGADGVLRSFAPDGSVLDYRQLDPDQLGEFATMQLQGWERWAAENGDEIPASVVALAEAAHDVDGRHVTELDKLLHPTEKPNFEATRNVQARTSEAENSPALLFDKRQQCFIGYPCQYLYVCLLVFCRACYFPNGPPLGLCFPT